jgi:hypothetical protein
MVSSTDPPQVSHNSPTKESTSSIPKQRHHRWTLFFAILFLSPSLFGFGMKLFEFFHTFAADSGGRFAVTPIVNYLLASVGFLLLLVWATLNGMFTDLESPKEIMLDNERRLDLESMQISDGRATVSNLGREQHV